MCYGRHFVCHDVHRVNKTRVVAARIHVWQHMKWRLVRQYELCHLMVNLSCLTRPIYRTSVIYLSLYVYVLPGNAFYFIHHLLHYLVSASRYKFARPLYARDIVILTSVFNSLLTEYTVNVSLPWLYLNSNTQLTLFYHDLISILINKYTVNVVLPWPDLTPNTFGDPKVHF